MPDDPQTNKEAQATNDAVEKPVAPILVQPVAPDQKPEKPETEQPRAAHKREPAKWTDIVMTGATVVIALATIAIGILAYRQWSDSSALNTAAGKAADAADKFQMSVADIQSKIALAQGNMKTMADSASSSLQTTQDAMHLEQRAWVAEIATGLDTPEIGKKIHSSITWSNSGKSFAKKVQSKSRLTFVPNELTEDAIKKITARSAVIGTPSVAVLAPNSQYKTTLDSIIPTTQLDKDRISGDWYTYIWGELTYRDIFNQPHTTIFCSYRQGITADFLQCPFHNDAN